MESIWAVRIDFWHENAGWFFAGFVDGVMFADKSEAERVQKHMTEKKPDDGGFFRFRYTLCEYGLQRSS
jgi:hypothetical protein